MPVQQIDQIGRRHPEDGAGQVVVEAGHQSRDITADGDSVQADLGAGLLGPDPGHDPADVPHSLRRAVEIVHHVLARDHGILRQPPGSRAVQGQHRQDHVETQILVQMPGPEYRQIKPRATHLGPVYAHHPGPGFRIMAQHHRVHPLVAGVAHPAFGPRFFRMRRIAAVEGDPLVGAISVGVGADLEIGRRLRSREEALRLGQPPFLAVELRRRAHFVVDLFVGAWIADRASPQQTHQDEFVAQGVACQRQGGTRHRKIVALTAEEVAPRACVEAARFGERADETD